jgi:hypothetical protein
MTMRTDRPRNQQLDAEELAAMLDFLEEGELLVVHHLDPLNPWVEVEVWVASHPATIAMVLESMFDPKKVRPHDRLTF